jgi:hypothetical protein
MNLHLTRTVFLVAGLAVLTAGCKAGPRRTPVLTAPVETGSGSLEAARKSLEGRWTLVSLDVTSPDGKQAKVDATGELTFDAFGNLGIEYRLSDEGRQALEGLGIRPANPRITSSGRVTIDPPQRRITYMPPDAESRAFDQDLAARRANPFALEHPRFYTIDPDGTLTLVTRHDNGQDAVKGRWKRAQ